MAYRPADLCATQEANDFLNEVPKKLPFMDTSCCPACAFMAKKLEAMWDEVRSEVDFVLTFEGMAGIFASKHIDIENIEEDPDGVNAFCWGYEAYQNRINKRNKLCLFLLLFGDTMNLSDMAKDLCKRKYLYPESKLARRCLDYKALEVHARKWKTEE